MYAWDCHRFSIDGFERPVRMLIEYHTNDTAPESCHLQEMGTRGILNRVFLDDPELVDYLRVTHGLPTMLSSFNITSRSLPGNGTEIHWMWQPEGFPVSSWTLTKISPDRDFEFDKLRLFWFDDTGVAYIDLERKHTVAEYGDSGPAHMIMREPMLMSALPEEQYDTALYHENGEVRAEIQHHRDRFCMEPVP